MMPFPCRCGRATAVLAVLGLAATGLAQYSYFGKSKVQTRDYGFQRLETDHFKVLFYPGGEALAEFAAEAGEDYYAGLAQDLGVELDFKVPLILYLSPGQFGETNVIMDVIEEGVGGFSELFKNRIVLPFNGSYDDFRHVIGHELTHIFEFRMFYQSRLAALLGAVGEFQIPLWVLEGFAEFQSGWVNVRSEVFMRDLVLNDRTVAFEDLHDGMGYLVYREGESFFQYVAEKYGRKKVYEFLHSLKSRRNVDATFAAVFGMDTKRFSREWLEWLRVKHWPEVTRLPAFRDQCRRLTDHREDGSVYNTAPALSASGTKVAMISDRREYVDCYVLSALDGRALRRVVKGERSGGFETMHLIRPGVAWSPDETLIALATTSGGRDNITLVEYPSGRVRRRLAVGLDAVYSPRFSPDGSSIAFVGLKNGFSDIYIVPAAGGEPRRLTYDMYEERDPAFSPGGDTVAFVSDRPDQGQPWTPGEQAVWLRDGEGRLTRVTERGGEVGYPVFTASGEYVLYVAADSGRNIHVLSLESGRVVRRTAFAGEVSYLTLSADDGRLAFAYFNDVGWDVCVMDDPLTRIPEVAGPAYRAPADTVTFSPQGIDYERVKPAGLSVTPDYAVGAASYSGYGGLTGAVQISLSDMLGDHRFEIYTDIYGDILNSDLVFQYWLLPFRMDYGFTFFQYREWPYYDPESYLVERVNRGIQAFSFYPFNRFLRTEFGLTGYWSDVGYWDYDPLPGGGWYRAGREHQWVTYGTAACVFDNTFWTADGPARGTRARLGADVSLLSDREFRSAGLDVRNYQRLGRRFVFASRAYGLGGFGRDADRYYIGGETVRGFGWSEFYDATGPAVALAGLELRYPFIDRLDLAFPLPLSIGGIRGVAFLDAGMVFRDSMRVWDGQNRRLDDLKLGAGVGIRIQISYFALMLDWAKPLSATENHGWKLIFGLGTDF